MVTFHLSDILMLFLKYLFLSNISAKHFLPPYINFNILHLKKSTTETMKLNQRLDNVY